MLKFNIRLLFVCTFLIFVFGCSDDNPVEPEEEHFEAIGLYIIAGPDTIAKYKDLVVSGNIEITASDSTGLLDIKFVEEDGHIGIPPTDDWALDWRIANETVAQMVSTDTQLEAYQIRIAGKNSGQTSIRILINHLGHKDYESADIPIIVRSDE
jgi:hypothetical protein